MRKIFLKLPLLAHLFLLVFLQVAILIRQVLRRMNLPVLLWPT